MQRPGGGDSDADSDSDSDPDTDSDTTPHPIDQLDDLALYINIGDSMGAGYNADGRNGSNGKGYSRLLLTDHGDYEDAGAGHAVVFQMTNITDPTAGTGRIPAGFSDGFCETINNPIITDGLRQMMLDNLDTMNQAIADVTAEVGGYLVDSHAMFLDHGMNARAASAGWTPTACTPPTRGTTSCAARSGTC